VAVAAILCFKSQNNIMGRAALPATLWVQCQEPGNRRLGRKINRLRGHKRQGYGFKTARLWVQGGGDSTISTAMVREVDR
jgi:hypothetical protein